MGYKRIIKPAYCKVCEKNVKAEKQEKEVSHLLHFILSIFTFGLWIIVWAFLSLSKTGTGNLVSKVNNFGNDFVDFTCSECGSKELAKIK